MEANSTQAASKVLGKNVGKIQSAAVLTGVMYAIVFLLMIPVFISRGYTLDNMFVVTSMLVISVLVVHFSVNGLYYMVVAIPLVYASITFVLGWLIWLFAPIVVSPFELVLGSFALFDIDFSFLTDFITRVGQTYMGIAGGLWWLVKKARDIKYAALYIYIIILGSIGMVSGLISPGIPMLFLIFWATLAYKINEDPRVNTNENLALVFKVIASLTVLVATMKNLYYANNTWYGEVSISLIVYSILFFILVSFGIWKPKKILDIVPNSVLTIGIKIGNIFKKFIFIKF